MSLKSKINGGGFWKTFWVSVLFLFFVQLSAQSNIVAQLTGNPMNTTDWEYLGQNGGGFVAGSDFIFTNDAQAQRGAIYYDQPFNLNQCKKWKIEFDLRIWGTGDPTWGHGDGVAFWYLDNPPQNFASGGALGIPMGGRGIFVMFDTFDNLQGAPGMDPMSEIQLYYGEMNFTGNSYENDPSMQVIYIDTTPFGVNIRDAQHQKVVIEWDSGHITVTFAGVQIYSGLLEAHDGVENLSEGYFGFSGATGAAYDQQSIKEVYVMMDSVELNVNEPIPLYSCDADGDGYADIGFDLTEQEPFLIDNPGDYTFEYFTNPFDPTSQIQNPADFINTIPGQQTIYVKVANSEECYDYGELLLIIDSMPEQISPVIVPSICDESGNDEITVDLTDYQSDFIPTSGLGLTFHYFKDAALTDEIPQAEWSAYTITSFPHSVWIIAEKEFATQSCSTLPGEIIFDLREDIPVNGEEFTLPGSIFCFDEDEPFMLDLTLLENVITGVEAQFFYYETWEAATAGGNDFIPNPENYEADGSGTVYVRLENEEYCAGVVTINFEISTNPSFTPIDPGIAKCDDDFDGFVEFDLLLDALPLLNTDPDYDVQWYATFEDAQNGTNPLTSPVVILPVSGGPVSFWAVISNGICDSIVEIPLLPGQGIEGVADQGDLPSVRVCDDDFDGQYFIDITLFEELLIPNQTGIQFFYYYSQSDAESGTNPISGDLQHLEIFGPTQIWVVIINEEGCRELRYISFEIGEDLQTNGDIFDLPPICLLEDDRIDLTQLETDITTETPVEFKYYETEAAAKVGGNNTIQNPMNYPVNGEGSVYVRIESTDGSKCPVIVELRFELGTEVDFLPGPYVLEGLCAETAIDLSLINEQIALDSEIVFFYFETESDALNNISPILNYTEYQPGQDFGVLYVRLQQPGRCPVVLPFEYRLSPLPENPFGELPFLCTGSTLLLDAGTTYPEGQYHWEWEDGSQAGPQLWITGPGTYYLTIISDMGCEITYELEIEQPATPVITNVVIGTDYIIVEATGSVNLEYSLDGVFWQSNPRFDNLIPGETYTVYVRERGCDPVMKSVTVLLISNFISPNGDGKNDFWVVRGLEGEIHIQIFDRFGKKIVDRTTQGLYSWDGKYRGENVSSGDYWYIIRLPQVGDEVSVKYSGHISVRNQ